MSDASNRTAKPCIALMGEFSAGKSTLLNMLLARNPLPVRITATAVPPVWISYGEEAASIIGHDGSETAIDIQDIGNTSLDQAQFIRLWLKADALEICDLIDMPGISDPNMSRDVWAHLLTHIDNVIWCTHATQAWRQSEAAMWEEIAPLTGDQNLLVVTQFDKIRSERDRTRLLARLRKETAGLFQKVFPISLLDAINAADEAQWQASGAGDFSSHLVGLLLRNEPQQTQPDPEPAPAIDENRIVPRRIARPRQPSTRSRGDADNQIGAAPGLEA